MVLTPWGTSESLRERRLRPGPGSHSDEVMKNQRERVFGAMIACVSERGYAATRVSDLVELSGVSSRTFYDIFGDKETCFIEALQAVLALGHAVSAGVDEKAAAESRSWKERALIDFRNFAAMVAGQPAAAKVVLIEAYAAGPRLLEPLDEEIARFEALIQSANDESPERAGMPQEMVSAHVGALQEIARERLRRGAAAELPEVIDEVAELILSYPPPPKPLHLATRSPAPRPEDLDAHNQAERALRALAVVVSEKGYAQTPIDEVIARASMSASTFYANFSGKEDALMAAIDSAGAQMVAAAVPAFERSPDWPAAIRAAFGALFDFLATRPALAHLMAVGVYGAGAAAAERRDRVLAPLVALVERGGGTRGSRLSALELEVLSGAVYGLAYRQVRRSGPESLPALAPVCTYLALTPFIGAEEACAVANSDGRRRGFRWQSEPSGEPVSFPSAERMLRYLATRVAGVEELAKAVGTPVEQVRAELAELRDAGLVQAISQAGPGGRVEELFSSPDMTEMRTTEWEAKPLAERERISAKVTEMVEANIALAIEAGTFDARTDRQLSHFHFRLDEQGWSELAEAMDISYDTVKEIGARSQARQEKEGDGGIEARVVLALFEMPDGDDPQKRE